jgi:hypothetical protein
MALWRKGNANRKMGIGFVASFNRRWLEGRAAGGCWEQESGGRAQAVTAWSLGRSFARFLAAAGRLRGLSDR